MEQSLREQINLLQFVPKLLSWASREELRLVLGQPPFRVSNEVRVTPLQAPLLENKNRSPVSTTKWSAEAMNSSLYPCICCVLDGEIDWTIGITEQLTRIIGQLDKRHGRYVLRLPTQTFLMMPPGVPFADASQPHWQGKAEEMPDSLIFWINPTPQGAELHLCRTRNGEHGGLCPTFVQDAHILSVAELLLDDLQKSAPHLSATASHYLTIILLRISEALQQSPITINHGLENLNSNGRPSESVLVARAQRYIQAHLGTQLSVQSIADHLYVSPSHLNRLFRRELGVSLMKYVTQCRMEIARSLLSDTNYSVMYISDFFGYTHPDVFSRAFKAYFGVSPSKLRREVAVAVRN